MPNSIAEDQPIPEDEPCVEGEPCCIELSAPGGQPVALMFAYRVPVEVVVMSIIPTFRAQSGYPGPLMFKVRDLSVAEQVALAAVPRQ